MVFFWLGLKIGIGVKRGLLKKGRMIPLTSLRFWMSLTNRRSGLINLDDGLMDIVQEDLVIESNMDPIGDECRQLDVDQQKGTSEVQEPLAIVTIASIDSLTIGEHIGSSLAVKFKPPRKLGIMQKDIKKGGAKKLVKSSQKKDVEKIKLVGEIFVESGAVKPLDSFFSFPLK